jgi:hypothetical protein
MQGRRSGGITERPVKRESENQNGIIRDFYYASNHTIAKYCKVSSHKTVPLMRRIYKVAVAGIKPFSLHCYSQLQ